MKKRLIAILLVLAISAFGIPAGITYAETGDDVNQVYSEAEYAENRVLVMYETGAVSASTASFLTEHQSLPNDGSSHVSEAFGLSSEGLGDEEVIRAESTLDQQTKILSQSLDNYEIEDTMLIDTNQKGSELVISVVTSDTMSTEELIERLSGQKGILYVEPDYTLYAENMPDWSDTYLNDMQHLMGNNSIHADAIWESDAFAEADTNTVTDPVVVAVVDTGVDYTHPDLKNRMWVKPETREFSQFAGKYGYDFSDNDYDPMDENDHGTHCAGIIAAEANNAEGITGVAGISNKVQIMAVRVLGANGSGLTDNIIAGMRYVVEMKKAGANVVAMNCSLGGNLTSLIYDAVINAAGQAGILSLVAAGNDSQDIDVNSTLPADTVSDYRITVSASDENGNIASYSNYGEKRSDIVAPGSNILSTVCSYNFAPYLYDAKTIRGYTDENGIEYAGNTEYYGEFDGAVIQQVKNAQGEIVDAVVPVTGTDYFGNVINDPEDPDHQVGQFGQSVMLANRAGGSNGKATLEITNDLDFPIGTNDQHLRWSITGAKPGDVYILYFPYEKTADNQINTKINMGFRSHTDLKGHDSGAFYFGDIKINGIDSQGTVDWTHYDPKNDDKGVSIDTSRNSVWRAGNYAAKVYPYQDIIDVKDAKADPAQGYGLGAVYCAKTDADVYFDFTSLGISRSDADETTFGKYGVMSGTSMATPTAAGFTAILAAMYPELSAIDLKKTVLSSTDGRYPGWCSTGGMIDFNYLEVSEENSNPAISSVEVAFDEHTVTLHGRGFGNAPVVKFTDNTSKEPSETIPLNDLSMDGSDIVIKNADKHGIIGSDITFVIENTDNGKKGTGTFYVVNGLARYQEGYLVQLLPDSLYDPKLIQEQGLLPECSRFITGANDLLLYDPAGNIYRLVKNTDSGAVNSRVIGKFMENSIYSYVAYILSTPLGRQSMWSTAWRDTGTLSYSIRRLSNPVYLGDTIFELVRVQMGYVSATLLLALDIESEEWTVCYDSILGYGSEPQDFSFDNILTTTMAAYKGRLYLFGSEISQEAYKGDPQPVWTASTDVLSCEPGEGAANWVKESADLPEPRAGGMAITQGGNLYYLLTNINQSTTDLNVYRFDGQAWSVAGTLPLPVNLVKTGGEVAHYVTNTVQYESRDGIECSLGIDQEGILLGGSSFDKSGDTFRFNTSTGKTEALGYTFWNSNSLSGTDGTAAGGALWVHYLDVGISRYLGRCIEIANDYVTLQKNITGFGEGIVRGTGSYSRGNSSKAVIKPQEGSYIYSAVSEGCGEDINLEEISDNYVEKIQERMAPVTLQYAAETDGTIHVEFGMVSTEIYSEPETALPVDTWDLGITTNGTINGVDLVSDNPDYAEVTADGMVTLKKEGIGHTVKITASAKDDPSVTAETMITILEETPPSDYTGMWQKSDGTWCYVKEGELDTTKTGFVYYEPENAWFYVEEGYAQSGWKRDDGTWYYMDPETFIMQTGWVKDNDKWYYMNSSGAMQTGWVLDDGTWYYMNSSGAMTTGWVAVNNVWYYLHSNGSMAANEWWDGYWLGASGAWTYLPKGSWKRDNVGWWYGDTSGWYAKNETIKIDNVEQSFNNRGYWIP